MQSVIVYGSNYKLLISNELKIIKNTIAKNRYLSFLHKNAVLKSIYDKNTDLMCPRIYLGADKALNDH